MSFNELAGIASFSAAAMSALPSFELYRRSSNVRSGSAANETSGSDRRRSWLESSSSERSAGGSSAGSARKRLRLRSSTSSLRRHAIPEGSSSIRLRDRSRDTRVSAVAELRSCGGIVQSSRQVSERSAVPSARAVSSGTSATALAPPLW